MTEGSRDQGQDVGGMSARAVAWTAWSLGGLSVAMFVACLALLLLAVATAGPFSASDAVSALLFLVPLLAFPVVGILIAARRPENPIGWICLVVGLFWMFIGLKEFSDAYAVARFGSAWSSLAFDALTQWIWVPPVGLLGIYMILLFPDGKLLSSRWRPFAWFAGAVVVLICVMFVLVPGPVEGHGGGPQSIRAGAACLGSRRRNIRCLATTFVHPGLGVEPGVALPAFRRRGTRADQVGSLRCLFYRRDLPEQPARPDPLRAGVPGCRSRRSVVAHARG